MKRGAMVGVGVVLAVVLAGCPPTPGLVGDWRIVYDDGFVEFWTFFNDGTFEWAFDDGEFGGEGTYIQTGNSVVAEEEWIDDEGVHTVETTITLAQNGLNLTGSLSEFLDGELQATFNFTGTKR